MYRVFFICAFALVTAFFTTQSVNAQTKSAGQPNSRYCVGEDTDIFTGIAHEAGSSQPDIKVTVNPIFEAAVLKARPSIPSLPVTPVYDLVVTAIPTINEYCLPQYDDNGGLIAPVAPPDILPFKGEIIIGNSPITKDGSLFVIGPGQFKLAGKNEYGEWKYEWKLYGWPNGIAKEVDMLRLFKAMNSKPPEPINVRIEVKRPNKETVFEITGFPLNNCAPLGPNNEIVWGRKKVIAMQGLTFSKNPSDDPFSKFVKEAAPGSVSVLIRTTVENYKAGLFAETKAQQEKGYHVLVAAHCIAGTVAFNQKSEFAGTCTDFLFADPPYNDPTIKLPPISKLPIAKEVKQAKDNRIEDYYGTLSWADGRGMMRPFVHHPFLFKGFDINKLHLKEFKKTIEDWHSSKLDWMPPKKKQEKKSAFQNTDILSAVASAGALLAQAGNGQGLAQNDASSNTPVITNLSSTKGTVGSNIQINGRNFGTKATVYLENDSGGFAWKEDISVTKEGGLDTVIYTIPEQMFIADAEAYETFEMSIRPLSVGHYSLSLSGSDENAFGSEPVTFEVTSDSESGER